MYKLYIHKGFPSDCVKKAECNINFLKNKVTFYFNKEIGYFINYNDINYYSINNNYLNLSITTYNKKKFIN